MGVVAGVWCSPVVPQAGVTFTVRPRRVAPGPGELGRAAIGTDGTVAGQEPTANYAGKGNRERSLLENCGSHVGR